MSSADTYRDMAEKLAEKLQLYLQADGWDMAKKCKDISVFSKKSPEFGGCLYKAEAVVNAAPETVFKYVDPLPDSFRMKWDNRMKGIETLKDIDKDLRVMRTYSSSACMGMISPRDFVDIIYTLKTDEFISTNAVSIDYDDCPPTPKHVRGWNHPCGLICRRIPDDPSRTILVNLIQPDLRGMLPRSIVDPALQSSIVDFYVNLRKYLQEQNELSSPHIE